MRDCFGTELAVGDVVAYGTNSGQRVGKVVKIKTAYDVWGMPSYPDQWNIDQVVSFTLEFTALHRFFTGGRYTISDPVEAKLYIVIKNGMP